MLGGGTIWLCIFAAATEQRHGKTRAFEMLFGVVVLIMHTANAPRGGMASKTTTLKAHVSEKIETNPREFSKPKDIPTRFKDEIRHTRCNDSDANHMRVHVH